MNLIDGFLQAEKEKKLQHTSDHITALSAVCAQLIQEVCIFSDLVFSRSLDWPVYLKISTFNESTVPVLKESLAEDRDTTRGYLDDLRLLVNSRKQGDAQSLSSVVNGIRNGAVGSSCSFIWLAYSMFFLDDQSGSQSGRK